MQTVPTEDEVREAFEKTFEKTPTLDTWGFFAYDDAPGGIGGGMGFFSWFDTQEEMIEFINRFPLLFHSGGEEEEFDEEVAARFDNVRNYLAKSRESGKLDKAAVEQINKLLRGCEQIEWFGQLKDLVSGDDKFAVAMRERSSGDSSAISESEIADFIGFLSEWGH